MPKLLPSRPNLEQLKKQAKDLLKAHKVGDPAAIELFLQHYPQRSNTGDASVRGASFSLSNAQLVIAREYGFAGWPELKEHVESMLLETGDPKELFKRAFAEDDAAEFRNLLQQFPAMRAQINDPVAAFDAPVITRVRSREMLDVLLEAGADINAKSRWWAGGFGLLDGAEPDLAGYAIQRGAIVDAHAAARLGLIKRLQELIDANPVLVHAPGGDGQTPLHFASTIEVAKFLVDRGANLDACDVDHESTPAQYMIRDRQEVARYLVGRGCRTDLLMAAALGDLDLIRKHLEADPQCIHLRVSDEYFPMINPRAGGTIYQWTLGWYVSPHDVAKQFGHDAAFSLLMERSPADVKLIASCWAADETTVQSLITNHPGLVDNLSAAYRRQIAHAARNDNLGAVRVMLGAGLPLDARGQHGATPLHWAAFHGNAPMTQDILRRKPPLEITDADFHGTPLGWAIHGSEHGWKCGTGNYAATVELLLQAGAALPENRNVGSPAVKATLNHYARAK